MNTLTLALHEYIRQCCPIVELLYVADPIVRSISYVADHTTNKSSMCLLCPWNIRSPILPLRTQYILLQTYHGARVACSHLCDTVVVGIAEHFTALGSSYNCTRMSCKQ